MRKIIILAAGLAALSITSVQAQDAGGGNAGMGGGGMGGMGGGRHHGQQQKNAKDAPAKPKVDDKAYNAALKGIPDKPYDAWHSVR
jgi:Spy/CpxP family protein refolding chaperone